MVEHLKEIDRVPYMVIDEGGALIDYPPLGVKGEFAVIGVAEKGIFDAYIETSAEGGHAFTPSLEGATAKLVSRLDTIQKNPPKNPPKAKLSAPVAAMLKELASHGGFSATGRPKRFFFGWWVVIGGLFIMATCYTAFVNCIPLFQTHIVRNLGITVGQFNTGVSLCTVVAGTRLLVSVVISNWFTLKRGLAVSIALAGSGLGGVVLSSATSAMIASWGWRPAFLLLAAICLVVALPISLVVFVTRPSDKGMAPYGAGQVEEAKADRSPDKPVTVSVGWLVLRRNAGFWLLVFGFVMMGITNGAFITNAVANMTSITVDGVEIVTGGHSTMWAGAVWSFYLGLVIFAKISLGAIYDRFGLKVGTGLGTAASVAAAIALCFAATDWGPIVACIFFAFATCMGTVARCSRAACGRCARR